MFYNQPERGNPAYAGAPHRKIRPLSSSSDDDHVDGVDDIPVKKPVQEEDEMS